MTTCQPDQVALFSMIKWPCFQLSKCKQDGPSGPLFGDQLALFSVDKNIQVHHIRKLKDLQRRYEGRAEPPEWVVKMVALRRKTLIVCERCHRAIHAGKYDGPRLM